MRDGGPISLNTQNPNLFFSPSILPLKKTKQARELSSLVAWKTLVYAASLRKHSYDLNSGYFLCKLSIEKKVQT